MVRFHFMDKDEFDILAKTIFPILWTNMLEIAPTGNSDEADFASWFSAVKQGLLQEQRKIILMSQGHELIGFFQYYTNGNELMMEEIQISRDWQSKQVFRGLYGFLLAILPTEIEVVEAYVNKKNTRSQGILRHLGLDIVGENKKGDSYLFRGDYSDLLKWYNSSNKTGR